MKTLKYLAVTACALSICVSAARAMNSAAVDDVIKLTKAGLGDEAIVAFINGKNANYDLSADDILLLKNQGLSSAVLAAMLNKGSASAAGIPAPAPTPAPNPPLVTVSPAAAPAPAASPVLAPAPNMSPDAAYFYQQLSPYGRWIMAEDNQWFWQPSVAATNPSWRPYWDQGHWVYTDSGWYWASDYSWGWAPFHYGRWNLHPLHGWLWYPDRVWAPAWVTWRSGDDYAGWAPLPPGAYFDLSGALVFRGRHVGIDFDFGFDWHHFNFCRVRELGDPRRIGFRRDDDRRMAFRRTTVINHYTVNRTVVDNHSELRVINHGIDPGRVAAVRGRRVETMHLEDMRTPAPNHAHERVDRDRKTMEVYRPHWGGDRH